MVRKTQNVEKVAAICGMIWFITIIDACFTWFLPWIVRYLIGTPIVIYATILLKRNDSLEITRDRYRLFLLFFLLSAFVVITRVSIFTLINYPLLYSPILCLVFWPRRVLVCFYEYLKRFVVFYAIVSVFVEFLVLSGIWKSLPYLILPSQDNVQESFGTINRFYGFFVIPENPTHEMIFYRAMGPLREGGHFSIFLGFIYFVEKAIFNKRNVWVLIAGLLSLSPNFVFFGIITEGYVAIKHKRVWKTVLGSFLFIMVVVGAVWFSPDFIKDEIVRIILERGLEENLESAGTGGYMELLDGRTNIEGLQMWNRFVKRADIYLLLRGARLADIEELYVLSDYRCLIFYYGYMGFSLILFCTIGISWGANKELYGFCVLLLGLWVMLSRAWMYHNLYIWTMMFLAVNMKIIHNSDSRMVSLVTKEHEYIK